MIKTIYVWHDCFVVKVPEAVWVFDFWKDPISGVHCLIR